MSKQLTMHSTNWWKDTFLNFSLWSLQFHRILSQNKMLFTAGRDCRQRML